MSQGYITCNPLEIPEAIELLIEEKLDEKEAKDYKKKFAPNFSQFKRGNGVSMLVLNKMLKPFNYSFEIKMIEDA